MYRRKKFAPARRCAGRRRRGNRVLEDLLSITILLCSAALLITVLAPWEEGSAYSAGQDTDVCWPEPLPAEPPLPADRGEPLPAEPVPVDSWQLLLVNRWHSLPEDYSVQLVELRNGFQVDERCYPDLQDMMDDCRAEGLSPVICSAYRTREYQERLYRAETERWLARGYSRASAETEAGKSVAVPGTSEHQLGLAVDIVDIGNQHLDASQENTAVQKWLMEHSWEYGFILRYPNNKSEITGIIYEPWHYRYVGREYAEELHRLGLCLEEYLERA